MNYLIQPTIATIRIETSNGKLISDTSAERVLSHTSRSNKLRNKMLCISSISIAFCLPSVVPQFSDGINVQKKVNRQKLKAPRIFIHAIM